MSRASLLDGLKSLIAPDDGPDVLELDIDGRSVRIRLRRNHRARRYTLRLPAGGGEPILTLPADGSLRAARRFVEREKQWLADKMEFRPTVIPFADGALVPLRGVNHRVVHTGARRGTVRRVEETALPELHVSGDIAHLHRRLTDWMKREARRDLEAAVARHAASISRQPSNITIRDTASRWGSCSAKGGLSFSWRLVLAPPRILDYVAAHEVAHLREMNHSPRFWRIVHDLCPHTETSRAWLRHHGPRLHAIGAAER